MLRIKKISILLKISNDRNNRIIKKKFIIISFFIKKTHAKFYLRKKINYKNYYLEPLQIILTLRNKKNCLILGSFFMYLLRYYYFNFFLTATSSYTSRISPTSISL